MTCHLTMPVARWCPLCSCWYKPHMGERSGLGLVDLALLSAIEECGSPPDRPHTKCAKVIGSVDEGLGLAYGYAYLALCDLAKPWILKPLLVDYHGDLGTRDTPSAAMRLTECRLSRAGACALAAERGEIGPIPLGLILGNAHLTGYQPPFDGHDVLGALRLILEDPLIPDDDLIAAIGMPSFPTGSNVLGDFGSLAKGEWTTFTLQAQLTVDETTSDVIVECLPPECSPARLAQILLGQYQPDSMKDEEDLDASELEIAGLVASVTVQSSLTGDRLVCTPTAGVSAERFLGHLQTVREITTEVFLKLPLPLAAMLRAWVVHWEDEDLVTSFELLEASIDEENAG